VASLVLVPWAETKWSAAGRIVSRTPVSLTEAGRNRSAEWADQLVALRPRAVYSSEVPPAAETALILATRYGIRHVLKEALAEVDAGLWAGLTYDEIKRRDVKIFKRWFEDPSSVCPPEGEELLAAAGRLEASLANVVRKHAEKTTAVVLGPFAFSVARCVIESVELTEARSMMRDDPLAYGIVDHREMSLEGPTPVTRDEHPCDTTERSVD